MAFRLLANGISQFAFSPQVGLGDLTTGFSDPALDTVDRVSDCTLFHFRLENEDELVLAHGKHASFPRDYPRSWPLTSLERKALFAAARIVAAGSKYTLSL